MATAPRSKDEQMPEPFDVTKTPEFQAALNDAVGKALIDHLGPLKEQITAARQGEIVDGGQVDGGQVDGGTENMLQRLAHLIADVSDQGSGRPPRLPPEVMARREDSRKRMFAALGAMRERVKALREAGKKGEARKALPRYRIMTKTCLNEVVYEPFKMDMASRQPVPVELHWTGPPNQAMRPINEAALEIFGHYRDWIGGIDTSVAKPGFISPKGVVILIGERYSPPVSAMQKNGFQPDFGDMQTEEREDSDGLDGKPFFESEVEPVGGGSYGAHGTVDPRARQVHVLGTIAAPAVQSQPSDVTRRSI